MSSVISRFSTVPIVLRLAIPLNNFHVCPKIRLWKMFGGLTPVGKKWFPDLLLQTNPVSRKVWPCNVMEIMEMSARGFFKAICSQHFDHILWGDHHSKFRSSLWETFLASFGQWIYFKYRWASEISLFRCRRDLRASWLDLALVEWWLRLQLQAEERQYSTSTYWQK